MSGSAIVGGILLTLCTAKAARVATRAAGCQDVLCMWARWVLAIGLGAVLIYIGIVHGLLRRDISRSSPKGTEHITGRPAAVAGAAIGLAGLALTALGALTAMSWHVGFLFYGLWLLVGMGVGGFFLALADRLPFVSMRRRRPGGA